MRGKETAMKKTCFVIIAVALCTLPLLSASSPGEVFSSPEKAVEAFVGAVRNFNYDRLIAIFGPGSDRLFKTHDPTADQNLRTAFISLYDKKHEIVNNTDGSRVLIVGPDKWPFPVPLTKSGNGWAFDSPAGFEEIINRRIGRDELAAIQTILAVADAQREYYRRNPTGSDLLSYAEKFRSTEGKKDGLYWKVKPGEAQSPLGAFVADASDEGYSKESSTYYGYRYRLLTSQGPNAPGGAYDYIIRGKQVFGFAVLAYPAAYGDSGIMTLMVSHSGIVYQRDLGDKTQELAEKITSFDPGQGWTKVAGSDLKPMPID
jgi:DUF2950 family protein